jgi:hypothetical protein
LGGVRCWYGWPMRLANGNPEKEKKHFQKCHFTSTLQLFKRVEIKNLKYKKEVSNKKWDRPSRSANKFKVLWPLLFHNISCRLCDSVTLTLSRCWRIWILFIIFNICIKSNPLASLGRHVECPDHSSWAQHNPPKRVKRDLLYTFENYYSFFNSSSSSSSPKWPLIQ